jgi:hypothetical protein
MEAGKDFWKFDRYERARYDEGAAVALLHVSSKLQFDFDVEQYSMTKFLSK